MPTVVDVMEALGAKLVSRAHFFEPESGKSLIRIAVSLAS